MFVFWRSASDLKEGGTRVEQTKREERWVGMTDDGPYYYLVLDPSREHGSLVLINVPDTKTRLRDFRLVQYGLRALAGPRSR